MTLSEFSKKYSLPKAKIETLLKKINVPVKTEIDKELEGILLNLSGTRVPLYPSSRRSALSPAELAVLLTYYELHIEWTIFFEDGFVPFGNMLFSLLRETGKTIDLPAAVIMELNRRTAAEPNDQKLGALKSLVIQMTKSGRGIVSPSRELSGPAFSEEIFRRHPGKNIAILAKNSAIPESLLREAKRQKLHAASFYLDSRGFMRVSREVLTANPSVKPAVPALSPLEPVRPEAVASASPVMTAAGTVQAEQAPPLLHTVPPQPRTALLSHPLQPFQPLSTPPVAAYPQGQAMAPEAAYPVGARRETVVPAHPLPGSPPPPGTYPAYPAQDPAPMMPGTPPHPFPGADIPPSSPGSFFPSSLIHPFPPSASPAVVSPPPPKQELPPIPEGVSAESVHDMSSVPKAPGSVDSAEVLPPGIVRNEQGRLVKYGRIHKAITKKSPDAAAQLADKSSSKGPATKKKKKKAPPLMMDEPLRPAPDKLGQQTMKERFVQGFDNLQPPEDEEDFFEEIEVKKLSKLLTALYVALGVLGLSIVILLLFQLF